MNSACRFCLKRNPQLSSINSETISIEGQTLELEAAIRRLFPIIDFNCISDLICNICVDQFRQMLGFHIQVLRVQHIWDQQYNNLHQVQSLCGTKKECLILPKPEIKSNTSILNCPLCNRQFYDKESMDRHAKLHYKTICSICNQGFSDMNSLKAHKQNFHDGNTSIQCLLCTSKLQTKSSFNRHLKIVHGLSPNIFFCGVCDNKNVVFLSQIFLWKHIKKHHIDCITDEQDLDNEYLDLNYLSEDMLKETQTLVEDETDIECTACNVVFATKFDHLMHDFIVHDDNTNQQDNDGAFDIIPETAFENDKDISMGMARIKQTKGIKFDLEPTNVIFQASDTEMKKPLTRKKLNIYCDICNKVFTNGNTFRKHKKFKHENKRDYKCSLCDKTYFQKSHLDKHIGKSHPISNKIS